jgi:hypothetical protein
MLNHRITRLVLTIGVATIVTMGSVASANTPTPDAFKASSFWNTPIASNAVVDANSDGIINFLMADNDLSGCLTLAGTPGNSWGMPSFVADASDPIFDVVSTNNSVPPEFGSLRIPNGAIAADTSDGEMVVYDMAKGVVAQLSKATYDSSTSEWTVSGGSIAYLASNGIDGRLAASDDSRNRGSFRGYPGSASMVHYDDVADGKLDNVVKIGVNTANSGFVFPMLNSDGDTTDPNAPRQGTRIRIKPSVNLASLGLSSQALVIAKGLQDYGMIVGDSTGGAMVLKLEDTEAGGRGQLWNLDRKSLCNIKGEHWEVLVTPGSASVTPAPAPSPSGFTDVSGHFFEADITWLVKAGITSGCSSTKFCPNQPVTRGQMAAFLERALNLEAAPSAGFTDTDGDTFEGDIDRLFAAGITKGCAPVKFCPGKLVTRGEMAAFLVRGFKLPAGGPSPFEDIAGSIFANDIVSLANAGITQGCTATTFCPTNYVTRGQMAAFLRRAEEG